ncbi:MAG: hypothetical protein ACLUHG_03485 [Sutterella wadsworthensis]
MLDNQKEAIQKLIAGARQTRRRRRPVTLERPKATRRHRLHLRSAAPVA